MRRRSPISIALEEATPHEWTPADDIINRVTSRVPPGKAVRLYMSRASMAGVVDPDSKPLEHKIKVGAREFVNKTIGSELASGRIERSYIDGVRHFRRKPQETQLQDVDRSMIEEIVMRVLSGSTKELPFQVLMIPAEPRRELAGTIAQAIIDGYSDKE